MIFLGLSIAVTIGLLLVLGTQALAVWLLSESLKTPVDAKSREWVVVVLEDG